MIAIYRYREDQKLECSQVPNKTQPRCNPGCDLPQRKLSNTFQLTHMPRGNHAQSIASNGDQKEDKTLLQHSQLRQHGEFRHVSVSERQRLRPCGQNLCVPFLRTVLPPEVDGALEQWRPTARQYNII